MGAPPTTHLKRKLKLHAVNSKLEYPLTTTYTLNAPDYTFNCKNVRVCLGANEATANVKPKYVCVHAIAKSEIKTNQRQTDDIQ